MRCWEITLATLVCLLSTVCSCMRSKMDCLNTWIIALLTFIGLLPSMNHKVLCKLACIKRCECTLVAFMRYLYRFWPSHVLLGQLFFLCHTPCINTMGLDWNNVERFENVFKWYMSQSSLTHDISLKVVWKWKCQVVLENVKWTYYDEYQKTVNHFVLLLGNPRPPVRGVR